MTRNEERFEAFLERYCAKHHITREEALTHIQVQVTKEMYDEEGNEYDHVEKTKISNWGSCEESGCVSVLISGGC